MKRGINGLFVVIGALLISLIIAAEFKIHNLNDKVQVLEQENKELKDKVYEAKLYKLSVKRYFNKERKGKELK